MPMAYVRHDYWSLFDPDVRTRNTREQSGDGQWNQWWIRHTNDQRMIFLLLVREMLQYFPFVSYSPHCHVIVRNLLLTNTFLIRSRSLWRSHHIHISNKLTHYFLFHSLSFFLELFVAIQTIHERWVHASMQSMFLVYIIYICICISRNRQRLSWEIDRIVCCAEIGWTRQIDW